MFDGTGASMDRPEAKRPIAARIGKHSRMRDELSEPMNRGCLPLPGRPSRAQSGRPSHGSVDSSRYVPAAPLVG